MAAISDYLEKQLLNFIFRGSKSFLGHSNIPDNPSNNITWGKPENISVALLNSVPKDNDTGATMDEVPATVINEAGIEGETYYARVSLGKPQETGNTVWTEVGKDPNTAYFVYTAGGGSIQGSGYYYPVYPDDGTGAAVIAAQQAGNGTTVEYEFLEHPGIKFHKPQTVGGAGVEENPDPSEIIYRFYDGNGFIQNFQNISFQSAGRMGWGDIKAVALMDSPNHGEGNILMYAPVQVAKTIGQGDVVQLIPSQLEISIK